MFWAECLWICRQQYDIVKLISCFLGEIYKVRKNIHIIFFSHLGNCRFLIKFTLQSYAKD